MVRIILCIFILFLVSCNYHSVNTTTFYGYYDKNYQKIKMKGAIIDGTESGHWQYYDTTGEIVEEGNFDTGCQVGDWNYSFNQRPDTILTWIKHSDVNGKFTFSLPKGFEISKFGSDAELVNYASKNGDVFSVKDFGIQSDEFMQNYFELNKSELLSDYEITFCKSTLIRSSNTKYFLDEYSLHHKKKNIDFSMFDIYVLFKNRMLLFGYCSDTTNYVMSRFYLSEIFYHSFYKKERIENALDPVNELIVR